MKSNRLFTLLLLTGICSGAFAQAVISAGPLALHGAYRASHIATKSLTAVSERLIATTNYTNDGSSYIPHDTTFLQYSNGRYRSVFGGYAFDYGAELLYNTGTGSYVNDIEVFGHFDSRNNILLDSEQSWNGSAYVNSDQEAVTYDGNNNILTEYYQQWNTGSSSWVDYFKYIFTYDANNNQITDAFQSFAFTTGALRNNTNYLSTYNSANKITQQIYQTWDTVGNAWLNNTKTDYTYDANNNLIQQTIQNWDAGSSTWTNSTNSLYTYNANLKASEIDQNWSSGTSAWVNTSKYLYTYDANNNLTSYVSQNWTGTSWDNNSQDLYTYSAGNDELTYVSQNWVTSAWVNQYQTVYTYDANHNQLSVISQTWNTGTAVWDNTNRTRNTYDSNNNITNTITDTWNVGGFWQATTSDKLVNDYYETYTPNGVATIPNAGGNLNIYPSPASDLMNIDLHWDLQQSAVIAIYDAMGRICRQWQTPSGASYESNISVAGMQTGTYYMTVKGQNGQITKSFSVVR